MTAGAAAGIALTLGIGLGVVASQPAAAAPAGARVCPTEDFVVGAGWGADRGRRAHTGIDLGGTRGTPIYAIEDGVINRTKRQSNDALQIVMRGRSGSMFYYGHMDSVLVRGGQKVQAGDVIGLMGDTGSPGAVHLHFEYWRSGGESDAVDPAPLITRVCRLDGSGQGARPTADPRPGPADGPAADPEQPKADESVTGEVFTN